MRASHCVAWGALLAAHSLGSPISGQQATYRSTSEGVSVDVSVIWRGRPVAGLSAADFAVADRGVPQTVGVEPTANLPVDLTLVVDESTLGQQLRPALDGDLRRLARSLRSTDRLRVIGFATHVREIQALQGPAGEVRDWQLHLRTLAGGDARFGRMRRADLDALHDPEWRYQSLSDALLLAISRRSDGGRRNLVVALTWAPMDDGSVAARRVILAPIFARSDAVLEFAVFRADDRGFLGAPRGLTLQFLDRDILAAATLTGGSVRNARDGIGVVAEILDVFREGYVLRYTATGVDPGGWHEVTVRVPAHPEYEVRARKGYLGR